MGSREYMAAARGTAHPAAGRGLLWVARMAAYAGPLIATALGLLAIRLVLAATGPASAGRRCPAGACVSDVALQGLGWLAVAGLGCLVAACLWSMLPVALESPQDAVATLLREDAPDLFARLDAAADAFEMPRIKTVHLSSQCNAAVGRKRALLAENRTARLVIGLPLLEVLSVEELDAVVAHELGHMLAPSRDADALDRASATIGRFAAIAGALGAAPAEHWLRMAWQRQTLALSGSLSQRSEWAADAASAAFAGCEAAASALVRAAVAARAETSILNRSRERMRQTGKPIEAPIELLRRWMRRLESRPDRDRFLRAALIWPTAAGDSHPSLADRLARLGADPSFPPAVLQPASSLLGAGLAPLRARTEASIARRITRAAAEAHRNHRWQLRQIADIDARAEAGLLSPLETVEWATLTYQLRRAREAIPPLRAAIAAAGPWPLLRYRVANCLVDIASRDGGPMMFDLAHEDTEIAADAAAWLADHLALAGDMRGATGYVRITERVARLRAAALVERCETGPDAVVAAHDLPAEAVGLLRECLSAHAPISGAWLARKPCHILRDDICLLLTIDVASALSDTELRLLRGRLAEQLGLLPFRVDLVDRSTAHGGALAARIKAAPDSDIMDWFAASDDMLAAATESDPAAELPDRELASAA